MCRKLAVLEMPALFPIVGDLNGNHIADHMKKRALDSINTIVENILTIVWVTSFFNCCWAGGDVFICIMDKTCISWYYNGEKSDELEFFPLS